MITQHDPLDSTLRKRPKLGLVVLLGLFSFQILRAPYLCPHSLYLWCIVCVAICYCICIVSEIFMNLKVEALHGSN